MKKKAIKRNRGNIEEGIIDPGCPDFEVGNMTRWDLTLLLDEEVRNV